MRAIHASIIALGIAAAGLLIAAAILVSDSKTEQPTVLEVWILRPWQMLALGYLGLQPTCQELEDFLGDVSPGYFAITGEPKRVGDFDFQLNDFYELADDPFGSVQCLVE